MLGARRLSTCHRVVAEASPSDPDRTVREFEALAEVSGYAKAREPIFCWAAGDAFRGERRGSVVVGCVGVAGQLGRRNRSSRLDSVAAVAKLVRDAIGNFDDAGPGYVEIGCLLQGYVRWRVTWPVRFGLVLLNPKALCLFNQCLHVQSSLSHSGRCVQVQQWSISRSTLFQRVQHSSDHAEPLAWQLSATLSILVRPSVRFIWLMSISDMTINFGISLLFRRNDNSHTSGATCCDIRQSISPEMCGQTEAIVAL